MKIDICDRRIESSFSVGQGQGFSTAFHPIRGDVRSTRGRTGTAVPSYLLILLSLNLAVAIQARAQAQGPDASYYKVKSIYVPPAKRPPTNYSLDQLERVRATGELPTFDGEQFQINLTGQEIGSRDDAAKLLTRFLESLKSPLRTGAQMRMTVNTTTPKPDERYVAERIAKGKESTKKRLSGEVKAVGKSTDDLLDEMGDALTHQASGTVTVYRYDQYVDTTMIDNTAIAITVRAANPVVSLHGKFYNSVAPTNRNELSVDAALASAITQIEADNGVTAVAGDTSKATLVLLPYEEGFKYAWKTEVTADGPYQIWVDAQTGKILQLLPNFFYSNAKGLVFNPSPSAGTKVDSFDVDPPSGGKYTLRMAGAVTMSNSGADGTTGVIQINDDGSGTANFDVSPIDGTVVERTNQMGYNGLFQQVNIFAHISNMRNVYTLLGSANFGQVDVVFNKPGGNAFCCPPNFHIGQATVGTSTSCNDVFNAGIDATVIAHEFGHRLNGLQYGVGGGAMTGAINEGLADFWADTNFNTDTFGGWWGHNCPTPVQSGWTPRRSEPLDVFPEHSSLPGASLEIHSAGQMISWAMWSARQGMNDATDFGTLSIDLNTIKAMTTAGVGVLVDGTAKSVHDSYQDLLKQLAPLYASSRLVHKLLAGYGRAGIFLAPKDAVIDIDHSYLNRADATGPTFTIWTGNDYAFNPDNSVNTTTQPFNTQFNVEVANDEAFTSNPVSSGWLGGVVSGAGGTATWTVPSGDWNTLKGADAIYYRLTTRDGGGGNVRQSWNPGNSLLVNVPVGKAAINGTGTKDCSCSAAAASSSSAMALIPALPIGLLVAYRRRLRDSWPIHAK